MTKVTEYPEPPGQQFLDGFEPEPAPKPVFNLRFERLDLENFRNHEQLHLELKPVTLITGPNGSGKSSIQMALEWLFSGRCAVTNERGQGPVGREGLDPGVTATVPGGGTISRSGNRLACSWSPGSKNPEVPVAAYIGCDPDRARLALQAGRFFRIDADARKALLFDLLDLHVTTDDVLTFLRNEGAPLKLAVEVVGKSALAQLSLAHKKLYDRRRDVNRLADQYAKAVKVAEQHTANGENGWESEADIQKLLDQHKLLLERDRQLIADEQAAKSKLSEMRSKLEMLERQAEQNPACAECGAPSPAQAQMKTEGELLRAAIERVTGELPSYIQSLSEQASQIATERDALLERIQSAKTLRESMSNLNANREALKRHQDEAAGLNILLPYFAEGPTGIMSRLIAPKIQQFEALLNAVGAPWGLEFRYGTATKPEIRQYSTHWVPYEALSDGQQIMASLAHQVVFARKFGLGVVCLDRIEALDDTNRARLLDICAGLVGDPDSGVVQILLFGVVPVTKQLRDKLADWVNHYELADHALNYVGL